MSRNLMRMAWMMTAMSAYVQDSVFGIQSPRLDTSKGSIPSDKQKCQPKAQHEFTCKNEIKVHFLIRKIKKNGEPYKDVNEAWGIDYFSLEKVVE